MSTRLSDSPSFAHLWGTNEGRAIFDDHGRLTSWLHVLTVLADAQAELGIIPRSSADVISVQARVDRLDLELVAVETRRTSHSTLGLIRAAQQLLPAEVAEHFYYGVTVQDVSDNATVMALRQVGDIVWRDLRRLANGLADLAQRHRDTLMVGRTHGQPGATITFGLKAASWADEVVRHLERLSDGRRRWLVGQLGGAVGTLGFFGELGPALRSRFCAGLALDDPHVPWLTSRDRLVEFATVLTMISGTLARIGNEVLELQRPEIGELREPTSSSAVGSITMPHKRNPELSEHLDTLARLIRSQAGVLMEGLVQIHERDGRGWKAEWVAFPEVCLLTTTSLEMAITLIEGLEVDAVRMAANHGAGGQTASTERVLATLSAALGKHRAQQTLQTVLADTAAGSTVGDAVLAAGLLSGAAVAEVVNDTRLPTAQHAVTYVVERVAAVLAAGPQTWSSAS